MCLNSLVSIVTGGHNDLCPSNRGLCVHAIAYVWRSKAAFWSVSFFPWCKPWGWVQIINIEGKCWYSWASPAILLLCYINNVLIFAYFNSLTFSYLHAQWKCLCLGLCRINKTGKCILKFNLCELCLTWTQEFHVYFWTMVHFELTMEVWTEPSMKSWINIIPRIFLCQNIKLSYWILIFN